LNGMKNEKSQVRYTITENSLLARIAAWKLKAESVAIVLGHTIHLHKTTKEEFLKNRRWVKHELCHIRQFEKHGFFPFVLKYIGQSIRHGYSKNPFEIEARLAETEDDL
jgi:hypothetical protein